MTPEQWQKVRPILECALEIEPESRPAYVDNACAGDEELRVEILSLLSEPKRSDSFLREPALDMVRRHMAQDQAQLDKAEEFVLVGKKISHYRILKKLGGGGMGVVYEAKDTRLGRHVALKFLPEELARDARALERFQREARATSALNHPHICAIYDFGECDRGPFMVMEVLEGSTLKHRISGKPLSCESVVQLGIHIAEALEAAHAKTVLHRDITPTNVFVTQRGEAKLLDFGLAKLAGASAKTLVIREATAAKQLEATTAERFEATTAERLKTSTTEYLNDLTLPGALMGTAPYMSPEQIRGQPVDARSDIFSCGAVLYEMVTGQPAFSGETIERIGEAILSKEPTSPRKLNPRLPARLEGVVLKALEKERSARYQSASDLLHDLNELQRANQRRKVWITSAAVAVFTLLVGIAAVVGIFLPKNSVNEAPNIIQRQITSNPVNDSVYMAAVSREGKVVAYTDLRGVHVRALDTGEVQDIPTSPDLCFR
jgi:eukaryotic-like serine/threonine-protein kinase